MTRTGPGAALLRRVLADADAEHWVHAVSVSPAQAKGGAVTRFVSVDGPDRGTQDISIGSVSGEIRVLGARTFIRGTPEALEALFEVPASVAPELGRTWVTLKPGDSDYQTVTIGVTIPSFLQEISFSGSITEGRADLDGRAMTLIEGTLTQSAGGGSGVLYVTSAARALPDLWMQVASGGSTTTTFGDWGHGVAVTAPSDAVPLPAVPGGTAPMVALHRY